MLGYLFQAWAVTDDPPDYKLIDTRGSSHVLISPVFFLITLAQVIFLTATGMVSIIHVNLSSRGSTVRKFFFCVVAYISRTPFVIHLHGSMFDVFFRTLPSIGRFLVRWMFARATRVVVLGERWRDFVTSEIGVTRSRIEVIYNGVPRPVAMPDQGPSTPSPCHILFLGRLDRRKGVPELLSALAHPALRDLSWRATLAGDGVVDAYRRQAAELGLADRLTFPGWLDQRQVEGLLREADALVLPSHHEGLPVAVVEALAHRVATITTPVGALPEFLVHEKSSLVVTPGDPEELAGALSRIITDRALRDAIAKGGYDVFTRHFDISKTAEAFARVYLSVC